MDNVKVINTPEDLLKVSEKQIKGEAIAPIKKRRGRPPKSLVEKKRGVGRPKGDAAIMNEYKARLIASPKSKKVLDVILDAALDDEHKHQSAAWKLLVERLMPLASFDKESGANGRPSININISGVGDNLNISGEEDIEGEFTND